MKSTCTPVLVCALLVCFTRTSQGSLIQGLLDFALLNPVETDGGNAKSNSSAFPTESAFPQESPFPAEPFPPDSAFTSNIGIQKDTLPPNSGSSIEPALPLNPLNPVFPTDPAHVPSNTGSSMDTGFPSGSSTSGTGLPMDPGFPVDPFPPRTGSRVPMDSGSPSDTGFPAEPAFPLDPFQSGTGSPADPGFPSDPVFPAEPAFPADQFPSGVEFPAFQGFPSNPFASGPSVDVNPTGGGSNTAWDSSPLFRFLPNMPTGKQFINLNTDATHTFQPTENWMGEPIGPAGPTIDTVAIDPMDPTIDTVVIEPFTPAIVKTAIDIIPPFIDTVGIDPVGLAGIDTSSPSGNNVDITNIGPLVPSNEIAIIPMDATHVTPEVVGQPFQSDIFPPNTMGSVDIIPDKPAMGSGVIPLGPAFRTPVALGPVTGSGVQAQIPMNWMQLYPRDRQPPKRQLNQAQFGLSEAPQISPENLWMEQASLNNFSKHRGISRKLRRERKLARKQRKLMRLRQKQQQKQQKQQQKKMLRNKGKKMNNTGPLGPKVARMMIPGQNTPFVGKNQRGRRKIPPCTRRRAQLGLCSPGMGQGVGQAFAVSGIDQGASHTFGGTGRGNRQTLGGALIDSPGRVQQRIIGVHKEVGIRGRIQTLQTQVSRLKHRMGGMNKRGRHGNSFNSFRHIDQQNIGQPLRDSVSLGSKRKQKGGKRKLNKKLKMPKMRQPTGMTPVDLSAPITKTGNNSKKNKPGNRDRKKWLKNGGKQGKQPATNAPGDSAVKDKKQNIRLNKGSKILKKNNKQGKRKKGKKKKSPIIRKSKQLKPVDLSFLKPGSKVTTVRPVPITQPLNIQHIPGFGHIDWGQSQGTGTAIHP